MISSAVRILLFVHSRTVRAILADRPPLNFHTAARLKLPLVNTAQHWRTVRGPLADCPQCIFKIENFSAEPLVDSFMNGGPSAFYPRTVRATNFQTAQNFANFHNFNFELGSLLK